MNQRHVVIGLGLIFWPLSLFLANTRQDFIGYAIPAVLVVLSFILSKLRPRLYFLPLLAIPFIEPKLAALPILIAFLDLFWKKTSKKTYAFLFLSLIILLVSWKPFIGQTIFTPDYQARQAVIRKTHLYPTVFTARLFQNKIRIYFDKFIDNFFALSDPNNYFFGFHPRQIPNNQNLIKLPFVGLLFVLYGLYHLPKSKDKKMIINTFLGSLISLSLLTVFDRNDFILWLPLSLIFFHGVCQFEKNYKSKAKYFFFAFILFAIPELIRVFVQFSQ